MLLLSIYSRYIKRQILCRNYRILEASVIPVPCFPKRFSTGSQPSRLLFTCLITKNHVDIFISIYCYLILTFILFDTILSITRYPIHINLVKEDIMLLSTFVVLAITAGAVIALFEDGQTAPNCCDW